MLLIGKGATVSVAIIDAGYRTVQAAIMETSVSENANASLTRAFKTDEPRSVCKLLLETFPSAGTKRENEMEITRYRASMIDARVVQA